MRRRDYLGPGLCAPRRSLHARGPRGRSRQHRCEGPDGHRCDPVRAGCLHHARARAAHRRAASVIARLVVGCFWSADTWRRSRRLPRQRPRAVVVIDPGHDLRANLQPEPIGPGSATRKIKDGGGTSGVVSGTTEAELNLAISLRVRALLERAGVRVVMTRTPHRRARASATSPAPGSRTAPARPSSCASTPTAPSRFCARVRTRSTRRSGRLDG